MTPDEIIEKCRKQQELQGHPDAMITFLLPAVRGEKRRLFGRHGGPLGRVLGTTKDGSVVAFKADEVMAAVVEQVAKENAALPPSGGAAHGGGVAAEELPGGV